MTAAGAVLPAAVLGPAVGDGRAAGAPAQVRHAVRHRRHGAAGGDARERARRLAVSSAPGLPAAHGRAARPATSSAARRRSSTASPTSTTGERFCERLRFAAYLRRHRIQIVHTYSFYPNVFAIAAARLARTPVVIASIRDMGVYLTPLQLRVQRVVCRLAHRIVVNADAVKQWLVADGYDEAKITVIPNGVELSRFRQPADGSALRRELGLPEGCPLVAVVSRLSPSKGLEDFLRAAAILKTKHPAARFLVVGQASPADEGYREALADVRRAPRARGAGRLHGPPARRARDPVAGRRCRCCPRSAKGCPTCCSSPWPRGVPVIATRVGGAAEAVEDGVTGLLVAPRASPKPSPRAIDRLLSDGELARRYGCAGRRRMTERFGFDAAIREDRAPVSIAARGARSCRLTEDASSATSRRSTGSPRRGTRSPRPRCLRCSNTRGRGPARRRSPAGASCTSWRSTSRPASRWPRSCGAAACSGGWSSSARSSSTSRRTSSPLTTPPSRCSPRRSCARATRCCSSASRAESPLVPALVRAYRGRGLVIHRRLRGLSVDPPRCELDAPGGAAQCRSPVGSQACPADRGTDRARARRGALAFADRPRPAPARGLRGRGRRVERARGDRARV